MGGSNSKKNKAMTAAEFQRVQASLQHVRKDDKEALRAVFKMFATSSTQSKKFQVKKPLFSETFHISGPLADRLFSMFDSNDDGKLDYQDFVRGLASLLHATLKEKIGLFFVLADSRRRRKLNKADFKFLLTSLAACNNCSVVFLLSGTGGEESQNSTVDQMVMERAFNNCDIEGTGEISAEAFEHWVMSCPPLRWFIEMELLIRHAVPPVDAARLVTDTIYERTNQEIIACLPMDMQQLDSSFRRLAKECLDQYMEVSYVDQQAYPDLLNKIAALESQVRTVNMKLRSAGSQQREQYRTKFRSELLETQMVLRTHGDKNQPQQQYTSQQMSSTPELADHLKSAIVFSTKRLVKAPQVNALAQSKPSLPPVSSSPRISERTQRAPSPSIRQTSRPAANYQVAFSSTSSQQSSMDSQQTTATTDSTVDPSFDPDLLVTACTVAKSDNPASPSARGDMTRTQSLNRPPSSESLQQQQRSLASSESVAGSGSSVGSETGSKMRAAIVALQTECERAQHDAKKLALELAAERDKRLDAEKRLQDALLKLEEVQTTAAQAQQRLASAQADYIRSLDDERKQAAETFASEQKKLQDKLDAALLAAADYKQQLAQMNSGEGSVEDMRRQFERQKLESDQVAQQLMIQLQNERKQWEQERNELLRKLDSNRALTPTAAQFVTPPMPEAVASTPISFHRPPYAMAREDGRARFERRLKEIEGEYSRRRLDGQ